MASSSQITDPSDLFKKRLDEESDAKARAVYERLLSGDASNPARLLLAYGDLADLYFKRGERYQAINVLEEYRDRFLDKSDVFLANKIENKIEFLSGATQLRSKPLKIEIALLDQCNLRCTMCLQTTFGKYEITEQQFHEIRALLPYLEIINWIGGEVFLSEYFEPLFDEAVRYPQITHHLITNGLRIDDRWAEKLARSRTSLLVSIDGFTKPTYERIRRGARFENLVASLGRLQKAFAAHPEVDVHERLAINAVLMRDNLDEIEQIVPFAHRFGFGAVKISSIVPFEPESEYLRQNVETDPQLSAKFMDSIAPRILKEAAEKGIHVRHLPVCTRPGSAPVEKSDAPKSPVDSTLVTCAYPWGSLFSDAKGAVKPFCQCGTFSAGNVFKQPVSEIWNGDGMRRYRELAHINASEDLLCWRCDMMEYRFKMKLMDPLW